MITQLNVTQDELDKYIFEMDEDISHLDNVDDFHTITDLNEQFSYTGPDLYKLMEIFERNFNTGYLVKHQGQTIIECLYNPIEEKHYFPENYMVAYFCQARKGNIIFQTNRFDDFIEYIEHKQLNQEDYRAFMINILGDYIDHPLDLSKTDANVLPF